MGMYVYDVQQEEMQREWTAFFEIQSEELETQVKKSQWNGMKCWMPCRRLSPVGR
jgi:hypothetical protein